MRKLSVAASKNYDILIGNGLLSQLGGYVKALEKIQTVALVSETINEKTALADCFFEEFSYENVNLYKGKLAFLVSTIVNAYINKRLSLFSC